MTCFLGEIEDTKDISKLNDLYVPPKTKFLHTKCTEFLKLFFVAWLLKNPLVPAVSQLEVQFKNSLEKVSITSNNRSWLIHIKNDSNMATEIDW